jgi:hypothetical protein
VEIDHLEGEGLNPKVGLIPEGDRYVDLPKRFSLFPWHNTVERCPGRSDTRPVDARGIERLDVYDVEVATSVHQHLAETLLVDDQIDDEWVPAWI